MPFRSATVCLLAAAAAIHAQPAIVPQHDLNRSSSLR